MNIYYKNGLSQVYFYEIIYYTTINNTIQPCQIRHHIYISNCILILNLIIIKCQLKILGNYTDLELCLIRYK